MDPGRFVGLCFRDHQRDVDGDRRNPGIGGRKPLILIADAHVSKARANGPAFFKMLDALAGCDDDLVFLGDIFDLWVALPRYENELHGRFLAWCRQQKQRRSIGYMEGNREFFLAANHADTFSWCSPGPWHCDRAGLLFCHGDQINQKDFRYLTWRKLSKNRIIKAILTGLPLGPALAEHLKRRLKYTNAAFRRRLPVEQFEVFVEARLREGVQTVFAGHFHQAYTHHHPGGAQLHALPAWLGTGCVSRYDTRERLLVSFVPAAPQG
jgi:UDP-2,3-diacylglucosamine pyrophosphatase LpxH